MVFKSKIQCNSSAGSALRRKTEDGRPKFPASAGPQSFYVIRKLRSPSFRGRLSVSRLRSNWIVTIQSKSKSPTPSPDSSPDPSPRLRLLRKASAHTSTVIYLFSWQSGCYERSSCVRRNFL